MTVDSASGQAFSIDWSMQDGCGSANVRTLEDICTLLVPSRVFASQTPLHRIVRYFEQAATVPGVFLEEGGVMAPLMRIETLVHLSRRYVKDLYIDKPAIEFLMHQHGCDALHLDAGLTIDQAIARAIERPVEIRYNPIVVTWPASDRLALLDVQVLINDQRAMLGRVLREVEQQRRQAHHAALHDRLTGLPNRPHALERLRAAGVRARTTAEPYAVLFMDFDHFKLVNDCLGHDAGDQLLVAIGQRLNHALTGFTGRAAGTERWLAARLGGDEFLVLLEGTTEREATALAEHLLEMMRPAYRLLGRDIGSLPSIGITLGGPGVREAVESTSADLLRAADLAMYKAKATGRGRHVMYDPSMAADTLRRVELEGELRKALEQETLQIAYQPIIACETGHLIGFEALARWQHPRLGAISPAEFVPIAEEAGLIRTLGWRMLRTAVTQLSQWQQRAGHPSASAPRLTMNVNLSKRQVLEPGLGEQLAGLLAEVGVAPGDLCLEITESVVMDRSDQMIHYLAALKQLGVRLAMDDFGTGLSSLTYLHRFPIDVLKIDRAFVQQMESTRAYAAVVQSVVTLARNLGMSVTVEGVETAEQLAQVQALECDSAQGYLFGRPLTVAAANDLVRRHVSGTLPWQRELAAA